MKQDETKILILEDDMEFRNILIKFFSINGIQALGAKTKKEALSILKKNTTEIKLLIIDLWIPNSNGIEFLQEFRNVPLPISNSIPAIMMSCIITPDVRKIGNQLGIIKYFEKPIHLYELLKVVSMALEPGKGSPLEYNLKVLKEKKFQRKRI